MHLISLTLHGFKSFPEKTVVRFNSGLTAIVGPNGSGKSNVTDAIRWVLGEQSVRTLRGDNMQDIIFSGTETRRPMSFAEVTMTLDNSDQLLKIDFREVAITRRLYRSGESEYLINQQQVRLKDIHNLFMDTGLGRDSYSIIGQGKVDEILSNKSEDRRRVFEEAAGIQKYKTRRTEAMRKLEQTEQNLTRVNDILAELGTQLDPLKKQSETAKTYLKLQDELRRIDVAQLGRQIRQAQQEQQSLAEQLDLARADLDNSRAKQEELELSQLEAREKLARSDENLQDLRRERNRLTEEETVIRQHEARLNERKNVLESRLGEQEDSAGQMDRQLLDLRADIDSRSEEKARQQKKAEEQRLTFADLRRQLKAESESLSHAEESLTVLRRRERALGERQLQLTGQKMRQDSEAQILSQRLETLGHEQEEAEAGRVDLESRRLECTAGLQKLHEEDQAYSQESLDIRTSIEQKRQELTAAGRCLEQQNQDIRNKTYRLDTLRDLERNLEGYAEPVRNILRRAEMDSHLRPQVRGALGSLLKVEQDYEMAIEIALGAAVQNIVVTSAQAAGDLIRLLKQERLGRATFLPIDTIRPRRIDDRELYELRSLRNKGYIGTAAELVTYPEEISGIIANLLGRIVVTDNLDNALWISRQFGQSFRIVTLDGDVVNPGGSMTGGYNRKKSSGLLGRARDISQLEKDLNALHRDLERMQGAVAAAEHELKEVVRRQEALQMKGMQLAQLRSREEARLASLDEQLRQTEESIERRLRQADDLRQKSEEAAGGSIAVSRHLEDLLAEQAGLAREIEAAETALTEAGNRRSEMRDSVAAAETELTRLEEGLRSLEALISHVRREYARREREAAEAREARDKAAAEIHELDAGIGEAESRRRAQKEQLEQNQEKINSLEDLRRRQDEAVNRLYGEIREQAQHTIRLEQHSEQLESRGTKLLENLDAARSRLWEDYELTWQKLPENDEEDELPDPAKTQKQINSLKARIRQLGPVNTQAIEDYEKVSERYEFLCGQRDDIEAAQAQLQTVITELLNAMRAQFKTNFDLIRSYFKDTFRELFGGGEADIALEGDSDILEASIEIKASPPGKKLQNMMLLSGGERSLTAIALLFAILKLRPTPFCVLDEIEAALDDVNALRFMDYIGNYKDKSQFIMVTHRKGTMESADTIYGVTMQEKGISKVLSMVMSD